jgi:TMEM175 potassium channel family protein
VASHEEKETARVEAFSDGIFGIAITLLILSVKVPNAKDILGKTTLVAALAMQWPQYRRT